MIARAPNPAGAKPQRRYHFHTPGVLYIGVTLLLAIGAFNSQNNLLFASLGLAIGGLLVSGVLSGAALIGLRLERLPIENARVGGRLVLRYRARNTNRLVPAFGLTLTELASVASRRNRLSGIDAEAPLATNWSRHIGPIRAFVTCVPSRGSGGEVEVQVVTEPFRRGRMTLGPVRLWTTFPFGLAKKSITFDLPGESVIHPVDLPIRQGVLDRLTVRAHSGVGAAVAPGHGDELYGLREYADGDNPRWIAWKRSARTGRLVVRQNTTPTPRVLWIVLRLERGIEERRNETAIALASALVRACSRERATVGLAVPSHGVVMQPRSAPRAVAAMLERLAVLDVELGDDGATFPSRAIRGAANAVIHAGAVDRGFATSRTRHIDVEDTDDLLAKGETLSEARDILRRVLVASERQASRRGWAVRAWRSIRGEIGV